MSRNLTLRKLDESDMMDAMHRTNPVAKYAFKKGNAAGVHATKQKNSRRQNRNEERLARRGIYEDYGQEVLV